MLTINTQAKGLCFKDITKDDLCDVLRLYNQNEINMYATGIDRPMSKEDITEKYLEVLINSHEFFAGIFREGAMDVAAVSNQSSGNDAPNYKMIGVVKGRIDYNNSEDAWISSILIDGGLQRKGIGSDAAAIIMQLLRDTYSIKRIMIGILSGNAVGKEFWKKLGFSYIRTIDQFMKLHSKTEDFIIMRKDLEK